MNRRGGAGRGCSQQLEPAQGGFGLRAAWQVLGPGGVLGEWPHGEQRCADELTMMVRLSRKL